MIRKPVHPGTVFMEDVLNPLTFLLQKLHWLLG